jgi:biotin carboxyl carrier protein
MRKFEIDSSEFLVENIKRDASGVSFEMNGKTYYVPKLKSYIVSGENNQKTVFLGEREIKVTSHPKVSPGESISGVDGGSIQSPMPGKIFKILIQEGLPVKKGETILIMEAMKMEHAIKAPHDGTLAKILFKEGEQVQGNVNLVEITE